MIVVTKLAVEFNIDTKTDDNPRLKGLKEPLLWYETHQYSTQSCGEGVLGKAETYANKTRSI